MRNKTIFLFSLFLLPLSVNASDFIQCGNDKRLPFEAVNIVSTILNIIKIIVPIILIIAGMISFFKVVIADKVDEEMRKAKNKLIQNIIAAIIVFLVFPIVNAVINFIGSSSDLNSCLSCFLDVAACDVVTDDSNLCPGILGEGYVYDENCNLISKPSNDSNSNNGNDNKNKPSTGYDKSTGLADGTKDGNFEGWGYRLYTPSKVDSSKPLIVYLHGIGERGNDLNKLLNDGGFAAHINNGSTYPAYILMPQLPSGNSWLTDPSKLIRLIDEIVSLYGIDKNRISLTGFSLGADSIPSIINSYPNYFSSTIIMSIDHPYDNEIHAKSFKNVPTWIFYGESDPYAGGSKSFYDMLIKNSVDAKITVYQNQEHSYLVKRVLDDNDSNVIDWILSKRKN